MGFRFKRRQLAARHCTHQHTRQVRTSDGELITQCTRCGRILSSVEALPVVSGEALAVEAARRQGRLNHHDRQRLNNDDLLRPPPGQLFPTAARIVAVILGLVLPAIAAAAPPASWPAEWTAYLIPDETYIDAVWSDPAYRAPIEAGVFLRGDPIAGGQMHAHILSGPYDFDLGDWRQRDQSFCLSRAPAGDLGLDMMQFPFDTSGVYMPTCLAGGNVPEPAAIAAAAAGLVLFKRRARP